MQSNDVSSGAIPRPHRLRHLIKGTGRIYAREKMIIIAQKHWNAHGVREIARVAGQDRLHFNFRGRTQPATVAKGALKTLETVFCNAAILPRRP